MIKENYIYVGIDLHKETHTAVMIDCYNQKLGEITFPNRPADFPKLVTKVKKCNTDGKEVVILSILVDTFISKISFPMQPGPEIGSISDA